MVGGRGDGGRNVNKKVYGESDMEFKRKSLKNSILFLEMEKGWTRVEQCVNWLHFLADGGGRGASGILHRRNSGRPRCVAVVSNGMV